ncbi:hypothetical protein M404DRAFT_172830 [Pisolithus tinctorius Marx 270]|uniref:CCHC-type domain-containing protein n=1 Tax=Pisolithus tinctorius Marx 270 TaxID=870435 RepID=A0A0C3N9M9_PISTI|nr:hypothetical protein M404DRAFT_172830 [Pisolithus tinctorius Marx 270]
MCHGQACYKEFYARFKSLKVQGCITNEMAGFLLESMVHPAIVKEALRRGCNQGSYLQMTIAFCEVALARDCFKLLYGHYPDESTPCSSSSSSCPSYSPCFTPTRTQPSHGTPMEIGATQFPSCPVPAHIKCFNCQGNHHKQDCPLQETALRQMMFEEMQTLFYDKQIKEMKSLGKEFGQ